MRTFEGPVVLAKRHDVTPFDCGKIPLNTFLTHYALSNQTNDSARTFVALQDNRVIGFYSLAAGAVMHDAAPTRMASGLARHPVPIVLMARFAVDLSVQRRGIGSALFKDAIKRFLNVRLEIGARAFVVHAKDDEARDYYLRYGMEPFPVTRSHLFYLAKDIERMLNRAQDKRR